MLNDLKGWNDSEHSAVFGELTEREKAIWSEAYECGVDDEDDRRQWEDHISAKFNPDNEGV